LTATVAQTLDYDEFGRVLQDIAPGFQPFGYVGGLYDPNTGLVRFGFCDYDPDTGRWMARDPILFARGGLNLCGYVAIDRVNLIDPQGTDDKGSEKDPVARVFDIKTKNGGQSGGTLTHPDGRREPLRLNSEFGIRDVVTTAKNTILGIQFLIGGRAGINECHFGRDRDGAIRGGPRAPSRSPTSNQYRSVTLGKRSPATAAAP
jgi:RHS repeat-associated protein